MLIKREYTIPVGENSQVQMPPLSIKHGDFEGKEEGQSG